jgi:hypothetical protein
LKAAGYDTDMYLIDTGVLELSALAEQLKAKQFDGVMIGPLLPQNWKPLQ